MRRFLVPFAASVCALSQGLPASAQGYIVPNGVTYGGFDPTFGYRINVVHDPSGSNPLYSTNTQFWLNPVEHAPPTNTFALVELADIGVRVFFVTANAPISLQGIQAQNYPELSEGSSYMFVSGTPFYLGLYTGANFAPPYPPSPPIDYTDPVFGWVQLVNNDGLIQLIDGAAGYGGGGIYAGTQNIIGVPEPNAFALALLGGVVLLMSAKANGSSKRASESGKPCPVAAQADRFPEAPPGSGHDA